MAGSSIATSTIVFTDVVDSTPHRARLGEIASDRLFRDHEQRLSDIVSAHGGRVVKAAGDGIMATFDAACDAVTAAVAMQRQAHGGSDGLAIRIGAAAGDVSWEDDDCFGLPVVVASRLEHEASAGQILVSQVVRWLAGDRAGDHYEHLGERDLKGLPEPVDVYEVCWEPDAVDEAPIELGGIPLPAALRVASGFEFVGRAEEWETLAEVWSTVRSGGRHIVLVGGEAGAGKTRLAAEFARRCHIDGAAVMFGGCDSELGPPYQPWAQALDHLVRSVPGELQSDALAPDLAELLLLLPQLDRLFPGLTRPATTDPEADRFRLFTAIDQVLADVGSRRPVVLVLDDLHWAGAQTLALLRHVARHGSADRLFVIGTFRHTNDEIGDPLASCLADLRRLDGVRRVRLEGLDVDSVEHLLVEATGRQLDAELRQVAATVARRSAGNAFYAGELCRQLGAAGALDGAGGRRTTATDVETIAVPDSVKEVVTARLGSLHPHARAMVELAAVAGARVEFRVLRLAAELGDDELAVALDELVDAGLLADAGDVQLTYQFPHALVRDSVEDTVAPISRARLHQRIALALELVHEADRRPVVADLARHFAAAAPVGESGKAVYYGRRAAGQAMRSAAFDEVISHLTTTLVLAQRGAAERIELLLELGLAQVRDARYVESISTCELAFEEGRALGDATLVARAAIGYEQAVHMPGLPGGPAVSLVLEAKELLGDRADPQLAARLHASLARAYSHAGDSARSLEVADEALALARRCNDVDSLGAALEAALISTTDPRRMLELADEIDELAAGSTDPWHALYATTNRLRALIILGRLDEAREVLIVHQSSSARGRYPAFQFVGQAFEVALLLAAGRFTEAEAAAERAHSLGMAGNTPFDAGVYGLHMFAIRREQGRLGEVAPVLRLVASRDLDQPMWRPGLAALYADLGLLDEARGEFASLAADDFASIPRDAVWPACAAFLADVCLALGDREHAAVIYDALSDFRDCNLMVGMTICFGPADRLLGGLAALLGRDSEAERHFVAALALADLSSSPVWRAHALFDHATFLADRGEVERAAELGTLAHQTAAVLGMAALAERPVPGQEVERVGDAPPSPRAVRPIDGLSHREIEVLRLVADGRSNREIGENLYISQNTVANHVRAILQKTGCANRAEAVAYAARHGLLEER